MFCQQICTEASVFLMGNVHKAACRSVANQNCFNHFYDNWRSCLSREIEARIIHVQHRHFSRHTRKNESISVSGHHLIFPLHEQWLENPHIERAEAISSATRSRSNLRNHHFMFSISCYCIFLHLCLQLTFVRFGSAVYSHIFATSHLDIFANNWKLAGFHLH